MGTYDGTTATLYLDGTAVALGSASPSSNTDTSKLRIGDFAYTGFYLPGAVDEVRIYDRALTATEVVEVFGDN